jgi:hypothetical protein
MVTSVKELVLLIRHYCTLRSVGVRWGRAAWSKREGGCQQDRVAKTMSEVDILRDSQTRLSSSVWCLCHEESALVCFEFSSLGGLVTENKKAHKHAPET